MSRRMKTKQELLDEVNGMNLPEEMKVVFRRVINTVESELTDDQWRDYELDLDKYQRTMSEYRTAVTGIEKCSKNGNGSATKSATIVQQNR